MQRQFVIPDVSKQDLKAAQLSNQGNTFNTMAAALAKRNQTSDERAEETQATNSVAESKTSGTSSSSSASASKKDARSSVHKSKSKLSTLASAKQKSSKEKVKEEEQKSEVASKQCLVIEYYEVKKINERIEKYEDYLETLLETKDLSLSDQVTIQAKIDNANALKIIKGDVVDFEKFTDACGFSVTAKMIKKHRNKSFLNKYIRSQGSILIDDIEAILPACYATELNFRRMRQLLEKYKTHLDDAFFQSQTLQNKKQVINVLLDILNLKVDSDPDQTLALFNMKWNGGVYDIVKHRNKLFEKAAMKSAGQELKENIETILRTLNTSIKPKP
jgi:transcription elongation factor Elf1